MITLVSATDPPSSSLSSLSPIFFLAYKEGKKKKVICYYVSCSVWNGSSDKQLALYIWITQKKSINSNESTNPLISQWWIIIIYYSSSIIKDVCKLAVEFWDNVGFPYFFLDYQYKILAKVNYPHSKKIHGEFIVSMYYCVHHKLSWE